MLVTAFLVSAAGGVAGEDQLTDQERQFFESRIRPVLIEHCYRCHSQQADKAEGGLLLDTAAGLRTGGDSGPAVQTQDPQASPLLEAIRYEGLEMPPKGRLPDSVIRDFEAWVQMGAPDTRTEINAAPQRRQIDVQAGRSFWSFQPVHDSVPTTEDTEANSIDRFVQARLSQAGLKANPMARPAARIRRLYFDLTGLPPTVAQLNEFLAAPTPDSWQVIVDRLLDSPQFGVHWGRHWLDVARYADSNGGDFNATFHNAWRYRNYVVDAFNQDKPFDTFIREQLAGDLLPADDDRQRTQQLVATGFLMLGTKMLSERDKAKLQMDVVDEQINTVGAAFLGMTLGCARCHDHKFDPIPTKDYYALAGIFRSTRTLEGESQKYVSTWRKTKLPVAPEHEAALQQHKSKRQRLERQRKDVQKSIEQLTKNQRDASPFLVDDDQAVFVGDWAESKLTSAFVGRGYRHDKQQGKGKKSVTWSWRVPRDGRYEIRLSYNSAGNRARKVPVTVQSADLRRTVVVDQTRKPELDGRFHSLGVFPLTAPAAEISVSTAETVGYVIADAVQFVELDAGGQPVPLAKAADESTHQLQKLNETARSIAKQLQELQDTAPPPAPMALAAGDLSEVADCEICIRGEHQNLGPVVPRGFLQVVQTNNRPSPASDQSGRLQLAQWIADSANPLTGRVIVNRIWSHLLGEGLVRSVDNFGKLGQRPTHPQLLDHLAARFTTPYGQTTKAGHHGLGWSVKRLVREIVLSDVYARSSADDAGCRTVDPENRLLWKAHRRRLPAEALRDSLLAMSGRLDLSPAESPVAHLGTLVKNNQPGEDEYQQSDSQRRSLYLPIIRNELPPVLAVFDFADPDLVVGKRPVTNVPAQALFLLNSPFVMQAADQTAQHLLAAKPESAEGLIQRTYQLVLSRSATSQELQRAAAFLQLNDLAAAKEVAEIGTDGEPLVTRLSRFVHVLFASTEFRMLD